MKTVSLMLIGLLLLPAGCGNQVSQTRSSPSEPEVTIEHGDDSLETRLKSSNQSFQIAANPKYSTMLFKISALSQSAGITTVKGSVHQHLMNSSGSKAYFYVLSSNFLASYGYPRATLVEGQSLTVGNVVLVHYLTSPYSETVANKVVNFRQNTGRAYLTGEDNTARFDVDNDGMISTDASIGDAAIVAKAYEGSTLRPGLFLDVNGDGLLWRSEAIGILRYCIYNDKNCN